MKYMLLMQFSAADHRDDGMHTWSPEEVRANGAHMMDIHRQLVEAGEFVDGQGLAAPEAAKVVRSSGGDDLLVTEGPYPETKEFLAGYWLVDVESEERAVEIARLTSAAPGRGGAPCAMPIEVRQVMTGSPDA